MVQVVLPRILSLTLVACHRFTGRLTRRFLWGNLTLWPSSLKLAECGIAMFGWTGLSMGSTGGQTSVQGSWWVLFRFSKPLLAWTEAVPHRDAADRSISLTRSAS